MTSREYARCIHDPKYRAMSAIRFISATQKYSTSIFTVRHHCGINSNYRSELDRGREFVPFIRFETGGRSEAKPARKTERGRKMLKQRLSLEMKLSRFTLRSNGSQCNSRVE